MLTTQNVMTFTVTIGKREYEVYIDQQWKDESPTSYYQTFIYLNDEIINENSGKGLTLRGHYDTACARIYDYEEGMNEPNV